MTDMKLAVVPVDDKTAAVDLVNVHYEPQRRIEIYKCVLTKSQVRDMAKAKFKHEGGLYGKLWFELDSGMQKHYVNGMIAAVRSVGFGVEGE